MTTKTIATLLVTMAVLLALPAMSLPLARGNHSFPPCTNTTTQSISPAPGVVVTITTSACIVSSGGRYFGIHSITSSSNSMTIVPRGGTWDFFGEKYACGYSCGPGDTYSYPGSSGAGQFPNVNQTIGGFNTLVCTITQFNLSVLYQPTGQIYNLAAESLYRNPFCF